MTSMIFLVLSIGWTSIATFHPNDPNDLDTLTCQNYPDLHSEGPDVVFSSRKMRCHFQFGLRHCSLAYLESFSRMCLAPCPETNLWGLSQTVDGLIDVQVWYVQFTLLSSEIVSLVQVAKEEKARSCKTRRHQSRVSWSVGNARSGSW